MKWHFREITILFGIFQEYSQTNSLHDKSKIWDTDIVSDFYVHNLSWYFFLNLSLTFKVSS